MSSRIGRGTGRRTGSSIRGLEKEWMRRTRSYGRWSTVRWWRWSRVHLENGERERKREGREFRLSQRDFDDNVEYVATSLCAVSVVPGALKVSRWVCKKEKNEAVRASLQKREERKRRKRFESRQLKNSKRIKLCTQGGFVSTRIALVALSPLIRYARGEVKRVLREKVAELGQSESWRVWERRKLKFVAEDNLLRLRKTTIMAED